MSSNLESMLSKAKAAMANAYCPYSKFHVGACILTEKNNLFAGCNFENASYSLTSCAEGSAIAAMITAGETHISEIVIIGDSDAPCSPCGACRQRIREFAAPDTLIHCFNRAGQHITMAMDELLPNSFGPDYLPVL